MNKFTKVAVYGLSALMLLFGLVAVPTLAADHLDAPGLTPPGGDTRLDITDVYAFQSPTNANNTVLIMGINPVAGVLNDGTFRSGAVYDFKIDSNGDAKEDLTYRIRFGTPDGSKVQQVKLLQEGAAPDNDKPLAKGKTGQTISIPGGGKLTAGVFDDPFFFDLDNFRSGATFCGAPGGTPVKDFFLGLNISAIVLEVPSSWLGSNNIGVWARTVLNEKQVDRMGRPAINTVFIPNNPFEPSGSEPSQKNSFNAGQPRNDQKKFRSEVVDTLEIFYGAGNPTVAALADILLPDILTVDTSNPAGFLNGRGLSDDVIDAELPLVTNNLVTSDCVANDSAFPGVFPYLAPAN